MDDAGGAGLFTGPERREAGTTEKNRRTRSEKSHDRPQEEEPVDEASGSASSLIPKVDKKAHTKIPPPTSLPSPLL